MVDQRIGRMFPQAMPRGGLPEWATDPTRIQARTIDLTTALDNQKIEIGGNFLWAVNAVDSTGATDLTAKVDIRFGDENAGAVPFSMGTAVQGANFSRIFVTCDAQAGKSITLLYMLERPQNLRIVNPGSVFNQVQVTNYENFHPLAYYRSLITTNKVYGQNLSIRGDGTNQPIIGIVNEDGSNKTLYITRLEIHVKNPSGRSLDMIRGSNKTGPPAYVGGGTTWGLISRKLGYAGDTDFGVFHGTSSPANISAWGSSYYYPDQWHCKATTDSFVIVGPHTSLMALTEGNGILFTITNATLTTERLLMEFEGWVE